MSYKYTETLSQTFDIGDFIEPDILSVVDASVRKSGADILARANLANDLEKTFNVKAQIVQVSDAILEGSVPPSNPDDFLKYDLPDMPVIPDFYAEDYEKEAEAPIEVEAPIIIEPEVTEKETETLEIEAEAYLDTETYLDAETYLDTEAYLDLEEDIRFTAEPAEEEIAFYVPEPPRKSEGMEKVRRDMLKFDEARKDRIQTIIVISIIALLNFILFMYLINQ